MGDWGAAAFRDAQRPERVPGCSRRAEHLSGSPQRGNPSAMETGHTGAGLGMQRWHPSPAGTSGMSHGTPHAGRTLLRRQHGAASRIGSGIWDGAEPAQQTAPALGKASPRSPAPGVQPRDLWGGVASARIHPYCDSFCCGGGLFLFIPTPRFYPPRHRPAIAAPTP